MAKTPLNETQKKEALASIGGLKDKGVALPEKFVGLTGIGKAAAEAPAGISPQSSFDEILAFARKIDASDIHLSVNCPILFRKCAILQAQTKETLTYENIKKIIEGALEPSVLNDFLQTGDLEHIYVLPGMGRFRVSLFKQRFGWDVCVRLIPMTLRTIAELKLPNSCIGLTQWAQGMVLVTGPAGCGKTTTLATLVEAINTSREGHIITIEEPIEMVFTPKKCQITQREINLHTHTQLSALRGALREDPDILVVSQLHDLETIQLAMTAAETGHLVLGTMNTTDAAQTISHFIDSFPADEQTMIANMLSESLRGVICQQLIPTADGKGLVAAFEVLIVTQAVASMIRERKIQQIPNLIATGKLQGMVLLDHSLQKLVDEGIIRGSEAYIRAINPSQFKQHIAA